jgi:hypothetical protein
LISLSKERKHAVETLLSRVAGVHSVRVETTDLGDVEQIHVVSDGKLSAAQAARNIQSALLAALNLEVDARLISVVSLKPVPERAEAEEAAALVNRESRPRLVQISYQQDGFKITAHVELSWKGQSVRGSNQDTDTAKGRMVAAGRATLDALEQVMQQRVAFFLEGIELAQTFERSIAVASLRVVSDFYKADLVGCAIVGEDPNYAAAQAVLGAVNRSFPRLLADHATGRDDSRTDGLPTLYGEAREKYAMS